MTHEFNPLCEPNSWPPSLWAEARSDVVYSPLESDTRCDIAIIGAGYTGLWSAILLKEMRSEFDVVVVDAVEPGFGASGRNGGWCSGLFPVEIDSMVKVHGHEAALRMQRAAIAAVDDVGRYLDSSNIDCDWKKSGTLTVATNSVQEQRLQIGIARQHEFGLDTNDVRWLTSEELSARVRVEAARGALFSPHCAVIHPLKLVNGLAKRATDLGIRVVPNFRVVSINDDGILGHHNMRNVGLQATWVVQATEGYSSQFAGQKRSLIPLYSYMVATEPLPAETWDKIGWEARETLAEGRLMVTYAQRTGDGRIAFGGRGAGYRFASRISTHFDSNKGVRRRIVESLHDLFPVTRDVPITHHWGGPLAVPRDWHPSITIDRDTRRISAGGYVGDGVAMSHLAGRIVAAAIAGVDSPDLCLPVVQHKSRPWEPEPLRWIGVNTALKLPSLADAIEKRRKRPAKILGAAIDRLLG